MNFYNLHISDYLCCFIYVFYLHLGIIYIYTKKKSFLLKQDYHSLMRKRFVYTFRTYSSLSIVILLEYFANFNNTYSSIFFNPLQYLQNGSLEGGQDISVVLNIVQQTYILWNVIASYRFHIHDYCSEFGRLVLIHSMNV